MSTDGQLRELCDFKHRCQQNRLELELWTTDGRHTDTVRQWNNKTDTQTQSDSGTTRQKIAEGMLVR